MNGIRNLSTCALASILFGACTVGPNFKAPQAPAASSYTEQPLPEQTASAPGIGGEAQRFDGGTALPSHWWTTFGSATLNQAVEKALAESPTVAAAQAALHQAQANLSAQRGSLYPSLDGVANTTRQKIKGAAQGDPQLGSVIYTLYNTSVNLSYTLDVFGGERRAIEAQSAARDYQLHQLQATYQMLAANVVTSALLEASLRMQLAATAELEQSAHQELELTRQQQELGGAAAADVLSAQSNLAAIEATMPPLQHQLAAVRSQLAIYLGQRPDEYHAAPFDLNTLLLPQDIPVSLPSDLVRQRPDIQAAVAQLHQASAQIGVATANLFPAISLSGNFGDVSTTVRNLFNSSAWSVGANLTQPLFHGGTLIAQRRAAVAAYDEALAQYRSTLLTAFKNVADALNALDNDARALSAQYLAQTTAAGSLRLTEQRYALGGASHFELLLAEQQYQKARLGYVQALAARYEDTAALFQALGGEWNHGG